MTIVTSNQFTVPAASASGPISALSSTMASGDWAELTTTSGLNTILTNYLAGNYGTQNGNRGFHEYATRGAWMPAHGELHYRGSGHQSAIIHIRYRESDGTWTFLNTDVPWGHQYNHLAYSPANDRLYWKRPSDTTIEQWDWSASGGNAWSNASDMPQGFTSIATGMDWFPDANSGAGGLAHHDRYNLNGSDGGSLQVSNLAVTSWTTYENLFGGQNRLYHINAAYLPSQQSVLVGGGNTGPQIRVVDAGGNVTTRNDAPEGFGPGDNNGMGTIMADSVSGRIFLLVAESMSLYEHNYAADTWSLLSDVAADGGPTGMVRSFCTLLDTYGVIHVVEGTSTGPLQQWLYRL